MKERYGERGLDYEHMYDSRTLIREDFWRHGAVGLVPLALNASVPVLPFKRSTGRDSDVALTHISLVVKALLRDCQRLGLACPRQLRRGLHPLPVQLANRALDCRRRSRRTRMRDVPVETCQGLAVSKATGVEVRRAGVEFYRRRRRVRGPVESSASSSEASPILAVVRRYGQSASLRGQLVSSIAAKLCVGCMRAAMCLRRCVSCVEPRALMCSCVLPCNMPVWVDLLFIVPVMFFV